jgi:5'-phosphate synthase pdxT subunit
MVTVGILALQGGVAEHERMLRRIENVRPRWVRTAKDVEQVDALIIPGGESTAVGTLLSNDSRGIALRDCIVERANQGFPVWGTCMGSILLARKIQNNGQSHLGLMNIEIERNAYGGQLQSFRTEEVVQGMHGGAFPMVFIRAPLITKAGDGVEILARHQGHIVACKQGNLLATTFHPELTNDDRFHRFFLSACVL